MKNFLRILFVALLLASSMSTVAVAGGTDPVPTCDPFSNPNCHFVPTGVVAPGR